MAPDSFSYRTWNNSNYWVDVVFSPGNGRQTPAPAAGQTSFWQRTTIPGTSEISNTTSITLGLKFIRMFPDLLRAFVSIRDHIIQVRTRATYGRARARKLATVDFSGESASGWQQATFSSPSHHSKYHLRYFIYQPRGRHAHDHYLFLVNLDAIHSYCPAHRRAFIPMAQAR